jgi:hypothetical protein
VPPSFFQQYTGLLNVGNRVNFKNAIAKYAMLSVHGPTSPYSVAFILPNDGLGLLFRTIRENSLDDHACRAWGLFRIPQQANEQGFS